MRSAVAALALLLLLPQPVVSGSPPPVVGALVFTDLAIGTVYKAGGIVRTAGHVAPYIIFAGVPGDDPPTPVQVVCRHEGTDAATLKTDAQMQDYETGTTPPMGSEITAIGLLGGKWPPLVYRAVVDMYSRTRRAETVVVGPMIGFPFQGKANGMSGGPVLYRGKAVATISMFGDGHLFAVPLERQQCPAH